MTNTNVMDASAITALFRGEVGNERVEAILLDESTTCVMHAVNLCEVYYDALRDGGEGAGEETIRKAYATGMEVREDMDQGFWQLIGRLKASPGKISLADCFVLAMAIRTGGTLVTADHEFDAFVPLGLCPILFFR